MPELTTVHCDRYACNLAINTCAAKWKLGRGATPGVAESACRGCQQGKKSGELVRVVDFLVKYVRHDKIDGKYLMDGVDIYNTFKGANQ